ncbi:dinucleotide-utilizing enzyme possibly involved in molybdopterin or thiamin biosynthesis [Thermanaerovibrio velox DSM 12556]|uniref:Dinucleotide-utilizing enzyme possibly involved in molybdopterin or thiamin biosynthesis n=1 Tax=Thermanaerovibrio velox DSM 12556 TaxID=926567 RepID=H0UNI3_9BACT|nr:HesA/MoeB/ThiF family protein [Thermanaerovibrio velox]EHM09390.1 dinucleotide-utilizing enzyme possibly involved in molybdopterin or thiamin biosynthesis [Thermanaerovibrio velox DSM 12556]
MEGEVRFYSLREVEEMAEARGVTRREAEEAILEAGGCPERYRRNLGTLGVQGQLRLLRSKALVVGCGGLGGYVAEMLARAGVGSLILADGDVFSDNNLNRQLLCREEDLGRPKAQVAAERVAAVNRAVDVRAFCGYVREDNADSLVAGCQVVVDCLDNGSSRRILRDACSRNLVPMVHGAIGGFYAQVGVVTGEGGLGAFIEAMPDRGEEVRLGNPPFTPAFAAALEVCEALKVLTGLGGSLQGKLLWADLGAHQFMRLEP